MAKATCKDCADRKPACHDKCPKYLKFKQDLEREKQLRRYDYIDMSGGWAFAHKQPK